MSYLFAVIAILIGVTSLILARSVAVKSRRDQLSQREVTPFSVWERIAPTLSPRSIELALSAIAEGLDMDEAYLRPTDRFDEALTLKGLLIIDEDDASLDVADVVETKLSIGWNEEWETVQAAVIGIAEQTDQRGMA